MYESPINAIYGEITHKILRDQEENMMLEVQKAIGYAVDKEELIKALRYDRNQYEKGFKDGAEQKAKWQECIFDKIRAEIMAKSYSSHDDYFPRHIIDMSCVLEIISKYKAESEDEE